LFNVKNKTNEAFTDELSSEFIQKGFIR